jgi:hypothetical protein
VPQMIAAVTANRSGKRPGFESAVANLQASRMPPRPRAQYRHDEDADQHLVHFLRADVSLLTRMVIVVRGATNGSAR